MSLRTEHLRNEVKDGDNITPVKRGTHKNPDREKKSIPVVSIL